jgi:hypothetical protein
MIYSYRHPIAIARAKKIKEHWANVDLENTSQKAKETARMKALKVREERESLSKPAMFQMVEVERKIHFWNGTAWQGTGLTTDELYQKLGEAKLTERVALQDPISVYSIQIPPKVEDTKFRTVEAVKLFEVLDTALRHCNIKKVDLSSLRKTPK